MCNSFVDDEALDRPALSLFILPMLSSKSDGSSPLRLVTRGLDAVGLTAAGAAAKGAPTPSAIERMLLGMEVPPMLEALQLARVGVGDRAQ